MAGVQTAGVSSEIAPECVPGCVPEYVPLINGELWSEWMGGRLVSSPVPSTYHDDGSSD